MSERSDKDESAVREAVLEALPRLRRFALSLTGNPPDADDLLQSTVERALTRAGPGNKLEATKWIFRICRNLWIDELRSRKVREVAMPDMEWHGEPATDGENMIDQLAFREVAEAMDDLPENQRAVLSLVAIEGMSYREAAETLEVPTGTVMSRLARARATLAARFRDKP